MRLVEGLGTTGWMQRCFERWAQTLTALEILPTRARVRAIGIVLPDAEARYVWVMGGPDPLGRVVSGVQSCCEGGSVIV